jgi:hypothetical protein
LLAIASLVASLASILFSIIVNLVVAAYGPDIRDWVVAKRKQRIVDSPATGSANAPTAPLLLESENRPQRTFGPA